MNRQANSFSAAANGVSATLGSLPFRQWKSKARQSLSWILLALLAFSLGGCTTLSESSGDNPLESEAYGVWMGRLPCVGCPGVETRLVLWRNPDFFRLSETYLDTSGGPKTFTSFGRWRLEKVGKTPELGRLFLITDDARRTLYLERRPNGSLRLLDQNGDAPETEQDYILERTRASRE